MSIKNLFKWTVNSLLLIGFLITFFLDLTGITLHQWLGLAIGVIAVFHLVNHWQWVKAVTQRFFQNASAPNRVNYMLDFLMAIGLFMIVISGVVISTWFGVDGRAFENIRFLHVFVSITTLIALILKLALHWKCIAGAFKQIFRSKESAFSKPVGIEQGEGVKLVTRREALRTVGAISLVGALVMVKAVTSLEIPNLEADQPSSGSGLSTGSPASTTSGSIITPTTQPASGSSIPATTNQITSSCTVRCPNGCSYPGRCRKYTDGNKNSKCDLGECL